jgi:hypothetical protein
MPELALEAKMLANLATTINNRFHHDAGIQLTDKAFFGLETGCWQPSS